jgi:superfamily II DNA/RNA helicase
MTFKELQLKEELLDALFYLGFEKATPIQEKAIPILSEGKDLIGCAQTGTGKTAAFVLPMVNKLLDKSHDHIKALIIVPTRELALQIDQQIEGIIYGMNISSVALYGGGSGEDYANMKKALEAGVDIIVATPGKLLSHLNMGHANFDKLEYLIMDEADRMLDIGFHDDIMQIISYVPENRQTIMFSATMPDKIRKFAKKILKDPEEVSIAISKPSEKILQIAYLCYDEQKIQLIESLLVGKDYCKSIIIFCSTKKSVSSLVRALRKRDMSVAGISSDLEQSERESALLKFRSLETRIVVATDVISRGIDIKDIHLVINFDVPNDAEDYVHRIGRTARADASGIAITLINQKEMNDFNKIEKLIEADILKLPPPQELGQGPEWRVKDYSKSKGKRKFFKKK